MTQDIRLNNPDSRLVVRVYQALAIGQPVLTLLSDPTVCPSTYAR